MSTTSSVGRGRGRGRAKSQATASVGGSEMESLSETLSDMYMSVETSTKTSKLPDLSLMALRPGYGEYGHKVVLTVNYYDVKVANEIRLHHYDVSIKKPGFDRKIDRDQCRQLFWRLVEANQHVFGNLANLIYNDANSLWTKEKLNITRGSQQFEIKRTSPYGDRVEYTVELKYTSFINLDMMADYDATRSISIQFLDSLITQCVRCPLQAISERYYPFQSSIYLLPSDERSKQLTVPIGSGIEAWTGLYGAIKISESGKVMFNADVSTTVFHKIRMPLINFYLEVLNDCRGLKMQNFTENDFRDARSVAMNEQSRRNLKKALLGVNLRLIYGEQNTKKRDFKFVDVGQPSSVLRFKYVDRNDPNAREIEYTVERYFFEVKGMKLRFPHLPAIQVGQKKKQMYVPMELLIVSDKPQKVKKDLTEFQKAKLIRGAAMKPFDRQNRIHQILSSQFLNENDFLRNYNVRIANDMSKVDARIIDAPRLEFTVGARGPSYVPVENGKWNIRNKFHSCPDKVAFGVFCVDRAISINDFWNPYENLCRACEFLGLVFANKEPILEQWNTDESNYRDGLRKQVRNMIKSCDGVNLCIIFIMPSRWTTTYAAIKTVCDLEEGVSCQVILSKTFQNMRTSKPETNATAHNLVMKINAKLGGINNKIEKNYLAWEKFTNPKDPTIFIGIDVTHPKKGQGSSIATIVGSTDLDATRYQASVKIQKSNHECVVYLADVVKDRLITFNKINGCAPKHIIVYRDGISESEFSSTLQEEVASLIAACSKLDADYLPTISYVVVQKRHHTRFFPGSDILRKFGNAIQNNVPPGTVVDRGITSSKVFDFYLTSHLGSIGTSRPSHYYVLYDTWNLSADEWQQITFAMCHLYMRCNRSVSIPAPVYYAHLACARASLHHDELFGLRAPYESVPEGSMGRSELETIRIKEMKISANLNAPTMYFV